MSDGKKAIEKLTKELNEHNYNYYVLSEPVISDYDFDLLLKELICGCEFTNKKSRR